MTEMFDALRPDDKSIGEAEDNTEVWNTLVRNPLLAAGDSTREWGAASRDLLGPSYAKRLREWVERQPKKEENV